MALDDVGAPRPDKSVKIRIDGDGDGQHQGDHETFVLEAPKYAHMSVPVSCLLNHLSVDHVLLLMSALLCERRYEVPPLCICHS